jgi:2-polyprenyl-3-methyl-5-hydroxy-6-metoxy-1,4-benzoquinol methylase
MTSTYKRQKPDDYYSLERKEMLDFIPSECKTILEIGCGEGLFGSLVKSKIDSDYWGVEIEQDAFEIAKTRLDNVSLGDAFSIIQDLPGQYFDCIIFNDVLEHFTNPAQLLLQLKPVLKEKGFIVASIPNVRYIKNIKEFLIDKDWEYKDYGILDDTHYRFFTKKSIIRFFESIGFEILKIEGINPTKRVFLFALLNIFSLGLFSDSKYLQFACVVRKK